jgi:hypothetical protein
MTFDELSAAMQELAAAAPAAAAIYDYQHAIAGTPLHLNGEDYVPIGMRGWSRAVFRRQRDRAIQVFSVDSLVQYLDRWER